MSIDNKCLDAWGVHGEVCHLEYNREKATIDIHPFLEDLFSTRDNYFGYPEFQRFEKKNGIVTYHFSLTDFYEAFLGNYVPEEIADFLEKHIDSESPQAPTLVEKIRTCEEYTRFVITTYGPLGNFLCPINFPIKSLIKALPYKLMKRPTFKPKKVKLYRATRKDLENKKFHATRNIDTGRWNIRKLRKILLAKGPPIVIIRNRLSAPEELDYFSLIKYYNLSTDRLEIIRTK